jgi:hypothetical protein
MAGANRHVNQEHFMTESRYQTVCDDGVRPHERAAGNRNVLQATYAGSRACAISEGSR